MSHGRIGIVTLWKANYGSVLQCYATIKIFSSLGYDCELLVYKENNIVRRFAAGIRNRCYRYWVFLRYPKHKCKIKVSILSGKRQACVENFSINRFIEKNIFPKYMNYKELKEYASADLTRAILSGSDQVWNANCVDFFMPGFLEFAPKNKRVAWAASFGTGEIAEFNIKRFAKKIKAFSMISVREIGAERLVKELTGNDCARLLDPAMMLTAQEWKDYAKINASQLKNEKYLVAYFLDKPFPIALQVIENLRIHYGYKVVVVATGMNYLEVMEFDQIFEGDPLELLKLISESQFVITDSFHATLFAIEFKKKFWTIERQYSHSYNQTERIDTLLSLFNLKNRLLFKDTCLEDVEREVDYSNTDSIIRYERDKARSYIADILSKGD